MFSVLFVSIQALSLSFGNSNQITLERFVSQFEGWVRGNTIVSPGDGGR